MKNAYRIIVRKPEQKRLLERLKYRWEDDIKVDVKEIVHGCGCMWLMIESIGGLL
jgi:hypothetical protein